MKLFRYLLFLKRSADRIDEQIKFTTERVNDTKRMLAGEDGWYYGTVSSDDTETELTCTCKKVDKNVG